METQVTKKLPFWETIGRSFKYVFKNKALLIAILPVVGVLSVLQILLGLPFLCSIDSRVCQNDWRQTITLISLIAAAIGIIINYCRSIICKVNVDFISIKFWKQLGLYLVASIALSIIVLGPAFVCILAAVFLFNFIGVPSLAVAASIIIPFIFCVVFAPLFLVFPAIAAEDYSLINWSKLFAMAKGNHNAIFWAQFIIMIPYWLVSAMCVQLYQLLGINNYPVNLLFVIVGLTLGVLDACFKGAFFAHIYQFFKFYDKK